MLFICIKSFAFSPVHDAESGNKWLLSDTVYAITNVHVIAMTERNKVIDNATVIISNHKIVSLNGPVPANARIIDGKGKWLIPGLIDMHVHNLADVNFSDNYPTKGATLFADTQDLMLLYIANGVTTVFELSARVEHFGQRNEIIKGKVIGPRIALAFLIDGGDNTGNIANTPEDGRQTVRIAKAQGYEFIKVYSSLNIETFKAICDEAAKQHMKVVGHIPNTFRGKLEQAFVPNYGMVAHAEEWSKNSKDLSEEDAKRFSQLSKANNTWLCPTMITMKMIAAQSHSLAPVRALPALPYVHPLMQNKWLNANNYINFFQTGDTTKPNRFDSMVVFHPKLVKAFKEAGVPIVAGTDAGVSGLIWGYSLPDEIELLVIAGLTNEEALASATRLGATWLGIDDKTGTIEAGKFADLVLLDANPLDDINNIRRITGTFVNGKWLSRQTIDKMLAELKKKNNTNLGKQAYDWKNRKNL